ncbi:D-hexose-6-phosphate mutarotase [Waterburya agarophytonicola K14]|uniref:Putative glucose-6-phosphate 1-epimerase n=1 Tax=Waterburya agarophytonicola KI4 TaxID=2874699 RepID=A0A964FHC8_9CYAN|nr:D-hexose-6-phosphate mutarotase [Waterburya agarophytonicola]MCC0177524.1 D-hexose-6-phosphate mutarotase [Waterburya agarophytonicola KI4]
MNIEQLNADYGIVNKVKIVAGKGGFPIIEINNEYANATLSLYGGQILSFQPVNQAEDIMFLSNQAYYQEGKAIKGGTPICWPWFGPDPEDKGRASHGFVRNRLWTIREIVTTQDGSTEVVMGLLDTPETRKIWDYSFDMSIAITVGNSLTVELTTRNTGDNSFSITQALHTYFRIGDINQVQVLNLEDLSYLDKVDGGKNKTQTGTVTFDGECDRIYLDVPSQLIIDDSALGRKIKITAANSNTAIVWNPGATISANMADLGDLDYQRFVCVETANAANEVIEVAAGSDFNLTANYSCY